MATLGSGAARAQDEVPQEPSPEALVWTEAPLSDALYAFSEASGVEIVFALRLVSDVRVSGRYAPGDDAGAALTALLLGTGLRAERVRRGQYVLIEEPLNIPVVGDDPRFFTGVLEGRVVDAATDQPLWGAHVWLVDLDLGDVVDARGEFAVENLPTGTYSVRVSHIGYKPVRVELDVFPASPQLPPTVRLRPEAITSTSATVRPQGLPPEPEPGLAILSPPGVPNVTGRPALSLAGPVVSGDLFGGLSLVPGVSRASGASGPLVVRGAAPGRAPVVRDGVPIYSVGALGATFQPEALAAARLHSGPLPVELDGGAGVLELETRAPEDRQTGVVAAGLGGVHGVINTPITPTLGVQVGVGRPVPSDLPLASARTAGQALVVDPRSRAGTAEAESRTWDAETKLTWTPRPAQTVEVGGYLSAETLGASLGERLWRLHGRTDALSLRARGLVGDKTFVTTTAYRSRAVGEEDMSGLDTRTEIGEWGGRVEADHAFSLDHQIRVGASIAARTALARRRTTGARGRQDAVETAVYVRDSWKPTSRTELRPGVRVVASGGRVQVQPRFQARWSAVPQRLDLRAGLAQQSQSVHRLSGLAPGARDLAATRWLLAGARPGPRSGGDVDPATTWLGGVGGEWRPAEGVALGADVYTRVSRGLRLAPALAVSEPPVGVAALAEAFPSHRERAVGVDFAAAFRRDGWALQAGLSLARSEVRPETDTPDASGLWRASRYGRPVAFSVAGERSVGTGTVGLRLDVESGRMDARGGRQPLDVRLALGADVQTQMLGVTWTLGARAESRLAGQGPLADVPLVPGAPLAVGPLGSALVPGVRIAARW